jgi:hypothetical protein
MQRKIGGDIHVKNADRERPVHQTLAPVGSLRTASDVYRQARRTGSAGIQSLQHALVVGD